MCNRACIDFGRTHLTENDVKGKTVIEVGSLDVNGSLRAIAETLDPLRYVGVDIAEGPGVDEICDAGDLIARFGKDSFDVVISTEMLEHVRDWRLVVSNLKNLVRPNGVLIVTTRSKGFGYHGYPFDFWRYELMDARILFSDFSIESLERDPLSPGIFLKGRKPAAFLEHDLTWYQLYSVIKSKRCTAVSNNDIVLFKIYWKIRSFLSKVLPQRAKTVARKMIESVE